MTELDGLAMTELGGLAMTELDGLAMTELDGLAMAELDVVVVAVTVSAPMDTACVIRANTRIPYRAGARP